MSNVDKLNSGGYVYCVEKSAEPQTNGPENSSATPPTPKKKKRNLLLSVFGFLWAFWFGWSGWKNFSPKSESGSPEQWEDKTIAPRVAVLRQQLAAIEARPINTVDDYVAHTLETQPIVDEAKGLTQRQMTMFARFKQAHQNNADVQLLDYMMKLAEKDEQLMYLLADEIQCAKDLKALPESKRLAYYRTSVPQIKDKERQLAQDWLAITKDAKAQGISLPASTDLPEAH